MARLVTLMWEIAGEFRHAFRVTSRHPGFAAVVVCTLALGIGANTAIFSLVDHIVFRPLPYGEPERLFVVYEVIRPPEPPPLPVPVKLSHFEEWRRSSRSMARWALVDASRANVTGNGEPERLALGRVSPALFPLLRVEPRLGRLFLGEEAEVGRDRVVILSEALWRRRFNADPAIVGRTIVVDDDPHEVIGVLPASFTFPRISELYPLKIGATDPPQFWKPMAPSARERDPQAGFNYACIVRLADHATVERARSELVALQAAVSKSAPMGVSVEAALVPLQDQITGGSRGGLTVLLMAVGIVLLVACVNIMNLLLGRIVGRQRELAIRAAIGAGRGRLVRQLVVESLVLSLLGGGLGLLTADGARRLLPLYAPSDLPLLRGDIPLDGRILLFTLCVAVLTGLLVGLVPAWRFSRADPLEALKAGSASNPAASSTRRMRSLLVAAQVGMCALCLAAAGLLLQSLDALLRIDPGFEAAQVMTVDLSLPGRRYPTEESRAAFIRNTLDGLRQLPGVTSAATSNKLPLSGEGSNGVLSPEGFTLRPDQRPVGDVRVVSPDYIRTLGIPLRDGRFFTELDAGRRYTVVSASAAARLWPGQNPIGKRLRVGGGADAPLEVVGIVGDVRGVSLDQQPKLTVYLPHWRSFGPPNPRALDLSLAVRAEVDPRTLPAGIREVIRRLDPELPAQTFRTMDTVIAASVGQRRFQTVLVLLFATAATLLANLGIYGVVSYTVAQRRHEIGVRLALGARPREIRRLVVGEGLVPVVCGLATGLLIAAFGTNRLLGAMLFGVRPTDPGTLAAVAVLVLLVAVAAAFMPARRATRVDPLRSLRPE